MSARRSRAGAPDLVRLEVFHHLFAAVAEEMGAALQRSAFSPNIKERRDFSCALFDGDARMIGQAAHLPVHLGSTPLSVEAALSAFPPETLRPGDAIVLNDPFAGGTHLPDVTLVSPVFLPGSEPGSPRSPPEPGSPRSPRSKAGPDFYCANRAHHADVGGAHPGSMAPAADVHGEGLRVPPVLLVREGLMQRDVRALLLANMRVPREREGDLLAQWSANRVGERRLVELAREHGARELHARAGQLMDWTERLTAAALAAVPDGRYAFEDELETTCPATGELARIRLDLEVARGRVVCDFSRTDPELPSGCNTTRAVVLSAVFYALRLFLPEGTPTNDGILRVARVVTRPGTLVDARYPASVAAGNVETSQRLVDVLLGALAEALPDRVPAASAGTMSNLTFGGRRTGARAEDGDEAFSYYETLAGGAGGGPAGPGAHAVHTHMTNTRNTPIEALEVQLPVRVLACGVRRGSGGAGAMRGGDGLERRLRFLAPVRGAWVAERQLTGPAGRAGGRAGEPGAAWLIRAGRRGRRRVPGAAALELGAGDELLLHTPGGGGFGASRS